MSNNHRGEYHPGEEKLSPQELEKLKEKYIMPCIGHYYEEPMHLVQGEDQYVYDTDQREYLDCFSGILTTMSGHNVPEITEKVKSQIDNLVHTSTVYLIEPMMKLAEKLSKITPGDLQKTFFVNSGTEANEGALMLARAYTGSQQLIAFQHAYHGQSFVARGVTGISQWKAAEPQSMPGVFFTPNAYCYRCPFSLSYPGCDLNCAHYLENVIQSATPGRVAGIIAEPIQGVGGFVTPPPEFFSIIYDIIKEYGGLFISDEVQTAFGRTGSNFFGIEHWDIEPDIMTLAKGMGNGFPIGAFIATEEIAEAFSGSSISTFGGNHVSTTSALANLNYIENNDLADKAENVGSYLKEKLLALEEKYSIIGDVRGKGLMIGVELIKEEEQKTPAPEETARVMEVAKENGLLVGKGGFHGNVLRVAPPLIISQSDADEIAEIFDRTFAEVEKTMGGS